VGQKDDLDAMGLLKVDVLALGMLSAATAQTAAGQPIGAAYTLEMPCRWPTQTYDMICN
jgi:DNA polymerase III alpha subunit